MVDRVKQSRKFNIKEGQTNARRRNCVEGIMSVLRRKYDVDHIPVFGVEKVAGWIWTTLLSYNLVKYQKYKNKVQKNGQTWEKITEKTG